jgi:hypothetical protein
MEFFLVLAIEFKKYKKPAKLTIHVGDHFVDTFFLERDYPCTTKDILPFIEKRWYNSFGQPNLRWLWLNQRLTGIAKFWKIYRLNGQLLKDNVRIEVENSNNDYTNGFMTKNSLIKFSQVSLFEKDLVENNGEKMVKSFIKLRNGREKFRARKKLKNDPLPKLQTGFVRPQWPSPESFYIQGKKQHTEEKSIKNTRWWIGGNFTAEFPIVKKHYTKHLGPAGDKTQIGLIQGIEGHDLMLALYKPLLNIYNEN